VENLLTGKKKRGGQETANLNGMYVFPPCRCEQNVVQNTRHKSVSGEGAVYAISSAGEIRSDHAWGELLHGFVASKGRRGGEGLSTESKTRVSLRRKKSSGAEKRTPNTEESRLITG